ncbi:MAG TPA: PRC-barrel domain-containing protein [Woeseiaceae bacterium]|nr:PRC-barrel domain-containing protein [Woeseiaceae bacterium]
MKKFLLAMLGTALAGGVAYAQQEEPLDPTQDTAHEQTTEQGEVAGEWDEQDPMSETTDPTQSGTNDPTMSDPEDSTYGQESGQEQQSTTEDPMSSQEDLYGQESSGMQHDIADMSAEELKGKSLVSDTGEEIGQIDRVGHERVVTIDVGGFLGVGEKTIAIPVSELQVSSDGSLQTTLTKEELEARAEFSEQGFEEEGSQSTSTSY